MPRIASFGKLNANSLKGAARYSDVKLSVANMAGFDTPSNLIFINSCGPAVVAGLLYLNIP